MNAPLVSTTIPTLNSGKTLAKCLESIKNQTYRNIEVIIVDNFSRDKTVEIAKAYGVKVIQVSAGMAESRNIGARETNGKFILSVDSDMELTANIVEECVKTTLEGYDALIIPEMSVGNGFWAKCRSLETECYLGYDLIESARFFKRDVFEALGGYDPELLCGEDRDLHLRIKRTQYKIGRIKSLIKHHESRLSLLESMKKKYAYGKTLVKYKRKHPQEFKTQIKSVRVLPAFIKNRRRLAKDPVLTLGTIFMKACEFGAAGLGYFRGKMR